MDFSAREQKKTKCPWWNWWDVLREVQHSCERAQQKRVEQPASTPAFTWTVRATAALLLRVVYLYTVVQPRIKAQTVHFHLHTVYSIFEACRNMYFSIRTDWNEWMFMYSIIYCHASLLYPSMVGTRRRRLKDQHCLETAAYKKKRKTEKKRLLLWDLQY